MPNGALYPTRAERGLLYLLHRVPHLLGDLVSDFVEIVDLPRVFSGLLQGFLFGVGPDNDAAVKFYVSAA